MYRALVEKDSNFEGIFFAGVKTTGIFCRPTCRARKPKKENVEFFTSTQEALRRGYRPCKVCGPLLPQGSAPSYITELLKLAANSVSGRLNDAEIRDAGIDPSRVRRWFKKNHQMTFQAYLRSERLGRAFGHLTAGGKVIDTAFEHGYESLSGFTEAFKKLTGSNPKKSAGKNIIYVHQLHTPLGPMLAAAVKEGICLLEFTDRWALETELKYIQKHFQAPLVTAENPHLEKLKKQLDEYFAGKRTDFDLPLVTPGGEFYKKVWAGLRKIPYGETRSYKAQAEFLGCPKSIRAVARGNGANRIAIVIPCHRVIGSDGKLVGYAGGLARKQFLLDLEKRGLG